MIAKIPHITLSLFCIFIYFDKANLKYLFYLVNTNLYFSYNFKLKNIFFRFYESQLVKNKEFGFNL